MTHQQQLLFLLDYLIKERREAPVISIPDTEEEQKRILRALMNVRPPCPASEEFLRVQDEYLQEEIARKGVTDGMQLPEVQKKISIWQGDITTLNCAAIVNAANAGLLGCFVPCHSCIDNAIHTYAGIQLRRECEQIIRAQGQEEATGLAKITRGYNLPCDFVLHTVGPIVKGKPTQKDCELLAACYHSCLTLAERNKIKSIAFCCISTGEFHFPKEKAAGIAVDTVTEYLKHTKIEKVIFNVFKDCDKKIYERLLR